MAEFGIADVAGVTIGVAEVHVPARGMVQFAVGFVVAEPIAAVVGKPQFPGFRMPVEADRIAHAARKHFRHRVGAFVHAHTHDIGITIAVRLADIARSADRHVKHAVGTEGDEFPAVVRFRREPGADDGGARRIGEAGFDVVVADNPVHGRHVEGAVAERDAYRQGEPGRDYERVERLVAADAHRVNLAGAHAADEERALVAQRHRARVGHVVREYMDFKAGRQLDAVERQLLRANPRADNDENCKRAALQPCERTSGHCGWAVRDGEND